MYHAVSVYTPPDLAPDLSSGLGTRFISPPTPLIPRKRSILVSFRPHQGTACRYSRNPIANRRDR